MSVEGRPMSIHPHESQPPIQRFLDVPDLVGNVFERLDSASCRAFFQSHPHVASAGAVLSQSELRIELSPGKSLEDQWQRVLRLTRSQPMGHLILAGSSKHLLDFLRCVPEGMHEQKQRVLQGSELQLQVLIKLDDWGATCLQDCLHSWCREGHQGVPVWPVLDFCGKELTTEVDLRLTNRCALQNGTLLLCHSSCVKVAAKGVRMVGLTIKGWIGQQEAVVDVVDRGTLGMERCCVEGGYGLYGGGAVRVVGSSASLSAQQATFHSRIGSGLLMRSGSQAVLERCTLSENGLHGVYVCEASALHASRCRMDRNESTSIRVQEGAFASLDHCTSNGSKDGYGWYVQGKSGMQVMDSEASGSGMYGAFASGNGASLTLIRCQNNKNYYGWKAFGSGSTITAEGSSSRNNSWGNAVEEGGGRITLRGKVDLGNSFCVLQ